MSYIVTLKDRVERELRISQAAAASTRTEEFYDFRDRRIDLPVVQLPLDLLIYRMENFRTYSEQAEYLAKNGKPSTFFHGGQENESVQQIQHGILAKLARTGKANSIVPVIDVLSREGQRINLLINHSGVVVNGNRRLAAMRELYADDPATYQGFSHVNCGVLPADATPQDILEIEALLQARPETRLDYDWIGDAQLLLAMLPVKGTPEAVAKRLGRRVTEVKTVLQALAEADIYLKEWVNAPGEYRRVSEDGEQLFKDLPSLIQNKSSALQDASRAIAWALFDNREKLIGRVYNYNVAIGKRAEDVLERLGEDLGIALSTGDEEGAEDSDFTFGAEQSGTDYAPLVKALGPDRENDEGIDALVDICVSIVESEKDKKSGNAALKAITVANAKLTEVDLNRADKSTHESIERQLNAIIQKASDLNVSLVAIRLSSVSAGKR